MELPMLTETDGKVANSDLVLIKYVTGMPIDMIYHMLEEDNESKGYEDALANPDISYKEMNLSIIRNRLELKFQQVLLSYENDLQNIEFHINSRAEAGLVDVVRVMKIKKNTMQEHVNRIKQMEQDFQNKVAYTCSMLLSYEKGFQKGLAAVSLNQLGLNYNNKEGGIL